MNDGTKDKLSNIIKSGGITCGPNLVFEFYGASICNNCYTEMHKKCDDWSRNFIGNNERKEIAIKIFIELYGKEELMELLL